MADPVWLTKNLPALGEVEKSKNTGRPVPLYLANAKMPWVIAMAPGINMEKRGKANIDEIIIGSEGKVKTIFPFDDFNVAS